MQSVIIKLFNTTATKGRLFFLINCDTLFGMSEHFFNGITPFATGGQPFQIYALSKKKVDLSTSTGLLMMNFIIHMCASNLFALISLFFPNRNIFIVIFSISHC